MDKILDGNHIASKIKSEIKQKVLNRIKKGYAPPHLVAILIGNDGGSESYVNSKINDCKEVGFKSSLIQLPLQTTKIELLHVIETLNKNDEVDGYIIQLPLPDHIPLNDIKLAIDPSKDVDGFHPTNIGRMLLGLPTFLPATPWGILELLKRYQLETIGKQITIIGRSTLVGSPLSILLSQDNAHANATVTLTHRHTKNLKDICLSSDILIVAIGKPNFISAEYVKHGAIVIDVGTTRVDDSSRKRGWKLCGDVVFDSVYEKVSHITPVPGGVGPMTRIGLLQNTLLASEKSIYQ
jgi:methylenetetrahydrofolate dehydrogenase (NADP+)/methenyltetrahydrofolate cyclohydrolase